MPTDLERAVARLVEDCEDGSVRHYSGHEHPYTLSDLRTVLAGLAEAQRELGVQCCKVEMLKADLARPAWAGTAYRMEAQRANQARAALQARVERLETALREIASGCGCCELCKCSDAMIQQARAALAGETAGCGSRALPAGHPDHTGDCSTCDPEGA